MESNLIYVKTADLFADAQQIIEATKEYAYRSVNIAMLQRNWYLGKRISEEILNGEDRAEYSAETIITLSKQLTEIYGKGFSKNNLYRNLQFYRLFPQIFPTVMGKSELLTWSHYDILFTVSDDEARNWYAHEAFAESWSVRTLRRNIASQYYFRLLQSQNKQTIIDEMKDKTAEFQKDKLEFIKNPVVAEFLELAPNFEFNETKLESSIITHLQNFMMEIGKGFAFVERQKLVRTETEDFYIDLVFYNFILKCFVLVDLKMNTLTHRDVGQMDFYVRMFDDIYKKEDDNPTIGILLCSETDKTVAKYSVLKESKQIFASKYLTLLPTEKELEEEIERQKEIFAETHNTIDGVQK